MGSNHKSSKFKAAKIFSFSFMFLFLGEAVNYQNGSIFAFIAEGEGGGVKPKKEIML